MGTFIAAIIIIYIRVFLIKEKGGGVASASGIPASIVPAALSQNNSMPESKPIVFRYKLDIDDKDGSSIDSEYSYDEEQVIVDQLNRISKAALLFDQDAAYKKGVLKHLESCYLFSSLDDKVISGLAEQFEIVVSEISDC